MRTPRPLHATIAAIQYNKHPNTATLTTLYQILINHYVLNSFTYYNKPMTVEQFSQHTQIPLHYILKGIAGTAGLFKDMLKEENAKDTFRALISLSLNMSLSDRGLIAQQLQGLMASQGSGYKSFISATVNQTLDLLMKSNDRIIHIIQTIYGKDGGTTINILNAKDSAATNNILTVDKAVHLLRDAIDTKALPPGEILSLDNIFNEHVSDIPDVLAAPSELDGIREGKVELSKEYLGSKEPIPKALNP